MKELETNPCEYHYACLEGMEEKVYDLEQKNKALEEALVSKQGPEAGFWGRAASRLHTKNGQEDR